MPIYEYECTKCNHRFDKRQSYKDEAVANCPKCHNKSSRVMVPAPVIFKGSGFYVTDYRKDGTNAASSAPKASCSAPKSCCSENSCKGSCPSKG
jgi:putative FmdB family regulatory protein